MFDSCQRSQAAQFSSLSLHPQTNITKAWWSQVRRLTCCSLITWSSRFPWSNLKEVDMIWTHMRRRISCTLVNKESRRSYSRCTTKESHKDLFLIPLGKITTTNDHCSKRQRQKMWHSCIAREKACLSSKITIKLLLNRNLGSMIIITKLLRKLLRKIKHKFCTQTIRASIADSNRLFWAENDYKKLILMKFL